MDPFPMKKSSDKLKSDYRKRRYLCQVMFYMYKIITTWVFIFIHNLYFDCLFPQ